MYFPFLRGKQFELIALREIVGLIANSDCINPIIEPVKKKTTTYLKTLEALRIANINHTIVINPTVGDSKNIDYVCTNLLQPLSYKNFQLGIIIRSNTDISSIAQKLKKSGLNEQSLTIIISSINDEEFGTLLKFIESHNVAYILASPQLSERRRFLRDIRKVNDNLVYFSDSFTKQDRNKDYKKDTDEFFSDEHIYFSDDGFKGYSDFLTVGKEYSETGFSPYAVAIHLTYFNDEQEFRIHHFVSESDDDIYDVAGKFEEALQKLVPFIDDRGIDTIACNEFRNLNSSGKYPGLGTIKKLSLMNHLELVYRYFNLL